VPAGSTLSWRRAGADRDVGVPARGWRRRVLALPRQECQNASQEGAAGTAPETMGMIRYDLHCDQGHAFDGWYRDSDAFAALTRSGLVECPHCGSTAVQKQLMAPAVKKAPGVKGRPERSLAVRPDAAPRAPAAPVPAAAPAPRQAVAGPVPAQVMAVLQRMRAEIEKHCDYVGSDFNQFMHLEL